MTAVTAYLRQHPRLARGVGFGLIWGLASLVLYWRFPNNFLYPNFYAEDGSIFTRNILEQGFWGAFMTTFNGYYVWGLYLLEGLGFSLNAWWHQAQLVELPRSLAVVSYGFFGLVAALPMVLLRSYLRWWWRIIVSLGVVFVPLMGSDYAVLGTIGNLKFLFVPLAVMLLLYRLRLPRSARRIVLVDMLVGLCAYTNATVYLLLPILLLADGLRPRQLWHWRQTLRRGNMALWSALGLGVVLCYQLYIVATQGIPATPGYLDTPLQPAALIEVMVARSYLFPFTFWDYRALSDGVAVAGLGLLMGLIWRYGQRAHYGAYVLTFLSVAGMTGLFVWTRPGVTGLFNHYSTAGPDQFFYGQNMIAIIMVVLLLADVVQRLPRRWRVAGPALVAIVVLVLAGQTASYGSRDFMHQTVGTLKASAHKACALPGDRVTVTLYPLPIFTLERPRAEICTAAAMEYRPDIIDLGLKPNTPDLALLHTERVQQTFTSPRDDLSGVAVLVATYQRSWVPDYTFELRDSSCQKTVRTVMLPSSMQDNALVSARFDPIPNSRGRQYCFWIHSAQVNARPLAAYLSTTPYPGGSLKRDETVDTRTLVFHLLYPNMD